LRNPVHAGVSRLTSDNPGALAAHLKLDFECSLTFTSCGAKYVELRLRNLNGHNSLLI
jgi:hypothetical protein